MEAKIASVVLETTGKGTPVYKVCLEGDDKTYSAWAKKRDGSPLGAALVVGQTYELSVSSRTVGNTIYHSIDSLVATVPSPRPGALPPPALTDAGVEKASVVVDNWSSAKATERRSIERQQALRYAIEFQGGKDHIGGVDELLAVAQRFASFLAGE